MVSKIVVNLKSPDDKKSMSLPCGTLALKKTAGKLEHTEPELFNSCNRKDKNE